ncbi:MAG: DUF4342 domain-containing protein [Acidimicrobiia bacterium]|nr:DUF4342 domain-containing protein [Acidimicrobiia bacterium]MDH4307540.1 DUF4342 domain-containing protein [Acidimicrobiia bacterium]
MTTETPLKTERSIIEELKLGGEELLSTVKELIHEGNIRRIIIKNEDGKVVLEIPLTVGVAGAVLLPTLAAIGAVAALVTDCTILVERVAQPEDQTD